MKREQSVVQRIISIENLQKRSKRVAEGPKRPKTLSEAEDTYDIGDFEGVFNLWKQLFPNFSKSVPEWSKSV